MESTHPQKYHEDRTYALFAVVVHIGSGMRQGHYVAFTKAHDCWFLYDDDDIRYTHIVRFTLRVCTQHL
jgi:ubiquitin C-terminal hydrolase